ncbi:MAG: transposase [Ramlibacter sp.]|jgi:transposase|nr:transposase [Ramlibacter sp.]
MHVNQKPRRRHSEQFKSQVLAACAEPGASVSAVALSFGVNANLVHQWRRGRGFNANRAVGSSPVITPPPEFVALSLPSPPAPAPSSAAVAAAAVIRVQLKRGALDVNVVWPISAAADCAGWLRELLQ